jgi:hypothetical protein
VAILHGGNSPVTIFIEIGHSCRPCHIYVEVWKFHSIIGGLNRLYEIFSVSKKKLV